MRDHPTDPLTPAAVVAAGHRGDSPLIMRAGADPDPTVRRAAVGSFHRLGALSPSRLGTFLSDEDRRVRHRACELAARVVADPTLDDADRSTVVGLLVDRLADDDLVAEVAAFAIGESSTTDPTVVAAIEAMARTHEAHLCREAAIAALGSLGTGRDTILRALGRADVPADRATIRRRAVIALAPFEGDEVEAALAAALEDRDWQVRQAAEDLLAIPDDAIVRDGSDDLSGGSETS